MQKYMVFDYETFSECNLVDCGAYEYARHKSTEILCVAFRIGTRKTLLKGDCGFLSFEEWNRKAHDTAFIRALNDESIKLVAHNAFFEIVITRYVLPKIRNLLGSHKVESIPLFRWIDSAAMAATCGLPRSLDGSTGALGLSHQKDQEGSRVMLKLSKPREPTKIDPAIRYTPANAANDFRKLYKYCISDTNAETELFLKLPKLTDLEQTFWENDTRMNLWGFAVDQKLVKHAIRGIRKEKKQLDSRIQKLTNGKIDSARQTKAFLETLQSHGLKIKNVQAQTLEEISKKDIPEICKELIEIRLSSAKSATAKYQAFKNRSAFDGRARDTLLFYGAHTGRQAGRGLQPQNLFKSTLGVDDLETGIDLIRRGDIPAIQALFDRPMQLYASALRGCIVARKNKFLSVGDFSTIEVRVLFWLADHEEGLQMFRDGKDLYIDMAARIYDLSAKKILKEYKAGNINKRQLGKQTVLGAGFGIGVNGKKFQLTAKTYGLDIPIELAQKAILTYRKLHAPIPKLWTRLENDAIKAVLNPDMSFCSGRVNWQMTKCKNWLTCTLPIGRKLHYYKPQLAAVETLYGPKYELSHMAMDSYTKQYKRKKVWGGVLTENLVQAIARDLLYCAVDRAVFDGGMSVVLMVHDEIVCEANESDESLKYHMEIVPNWGSGLPVKAETFKALRYKK